ncbi:MAG: hypothetical protein A2W03_17230 [Candidatus Aminicenantes bacterium RBG_16_63_16]|nr:MAG: hypothetical protein A2W03_17230 [Candidatus Aminicenantes bacterium RBG_16_63_16]
MPKKEGRISSPWSLSRRRFMGLGAAALAYPLLSRIPCFATPLALPPDRSLSFFNTHTMESASVEYCQAGCLLAPSLEKIDYILRDHRSGEIKEIDVRLLDLLHSLSRKIASDQPFHVISGYRSPQTNALLREHTSGVAKNSLHLLGQAIDIRVPGLTVSDLYRAAVSLRSGGVGRYPEADFVHVDVGRVRTW